MVRLRLLPITLLTALASAVAASPAAADAVTSSNWAGYAVHRSGVQFTKVVGAWVQPTARCVRGERTYSAIWVGLGGYDESSNALEQIGSEVDCTAAGTVESTVWYELVPAPSRTIKLQVRPGDSLYATVTVRGNTVVMTIANRTTHKTFTKTLRASAVDVSSAEWIVEAPSECTSDNVCQTLPLANFGSAKFQLAGARAAGGHAGAIRDRAWDVSKIQLAAAGRRFISYGSSAPVVSLATPSTLSAQGTAFRVVYSTTSVQGPTYAHRAFTRLAGQLVRPVR